MLFKAPILLIFEKNCSWKSNFSKKYGYYHIMPSASWKIFTCLIWKNACNICKINTFANVAATLRLLTLFYISLFINKIIMNATKTLMSWAINFPSLLNFLDNIRKLGGVTYKPQGWLEEISNTIERGGGVSYIY